jgi:hypothetical protein
MKIVSKPLIVGGSKVGEFQAYEDIDPAFVPIDPGVRVLPAAFFVQKSFFTLIKRYEPGEKKTFPNGGYEVRGEGGELRSYDLDQVILYPETKTQRKALDLIFLGNEDAPTRGRKANEVKEIKVTSGRRGRPAMSSEVKAAKEAEMLAKAAKSGGKRGRPSGEGTPKLARVNTGGKRGRPSMTEAAIALKIADKANRISRSGGKRGRPSKHK